MSTTTVIATRLPRKHAETIRQECEQNKRNQAAGPRSLNQWIKNVINDKLGVREK